MTALRSTEHSHIPIYIIPPPSHIFSSINIPAILHAELAAFTRSFLAHIQELVPPSTTAQRCTSTGSPDSRPPTQRTGLDGIHAKGREKGRAQRSRREQSRPSTSAAFFHQVPLNALIRLHPCVAAQTLRTVANDVVSTSVIHHLPRRGASSSPLGGTLECQLRPIPRWYKIQWDGRARRHARESAGRCAYAARGVATVSALLRTGAGRGGRRQRLARCATHAFVLTATRCEVEQKASSHTRARGYGGASAEGGEVSTRADAAPQRTRRARGVHTAASRESLRSAERLPMLGRKTAVHASSSSWSSGGASCLREPREMCTTHLGPSSSCALCFEREESRERMECPRGGGAGAAMCRARGRVGESSCSCGTQRSERRARGRGERSGAGKRVPYSRDQARWESGRCVELPGTSWCGEPLWYGGRRCGEWSGAAG
ncbi:hypothetical protein DFH09DRAFT_1069232 [Mycena vulgaris]|nr:hypothetical protein DFH09DRAFT_1069232 [Mycena vulgaris]